MSENYYNYLRYLIGFSMGCIFMVTPIIWDLSSKEFKFNHSDKLELKLNHGEYYQCVAKD